MSKRLILFALLFALALFAGEKKPKQPFSMTFETTTDHAYGAMVVAAGPALKAAVREACMVNFTTEETWGGGAGYMRLSWTATCREQSDGKVAVNLAFQMRTSAVIGVGHDRDRETQAVLGRFWPSFEAALNAKTVTDTTTSPQPAPPELAAVTIKSIPEGTEITVDGKFFGNAPCTLKLPAGDHTMKATLTGFRAWERTITLTAGGAITVNVSLEHESGNVTQ